MVDENIIDDLEKLLHDVKQNTNEKIYIASTYRTAQEQEEIYSQNPGIAAPVNASEHQTGLALDLYVNKKHSGSLSTLMQANGYTLIVGNMDLLSDIPSSKDILQELDTNPGI